MIIKAVVLVGLLAATVTGSAIKGGHEEYSAKGATRQVEYQARETKGQQEAPAVELDQQREEKQQFYEAQPQLRAKTEERLEEQARLVQLPEQSRYEEYQQRDETKGAVKQPESLSASQLKETKQQYYEAKPQVREDAVALPVNRAEAKGEPVYALDQQQQVKLEDVQRLEETKGQKLDTVQRVEEHKYEQEQLAQQAVELTKQDNEQRRYEEQTEEVAQVREESQVKGGLRPAGAEAEPYAFDYSVEGSSRRETGDQNGVVRGQYTIQGADGSRRIVDYVADRDGFRAQVQTNEFGTESQQPANVALRSSQPSAEGITLRLEGKTRELVAAPVQVAAPLAVKSAPLVQSELVRAKPYEQSRAYKGALLGAAKGEPQYEVKTPALVQEPAPYKGQEQVLYPHRAATLESAKSAELRAAPRGPAPVVSVLRSPPVVTRASGFESATAHRPLPVVHSPVLAPAVRHLPPAVVHSPLGQPAVVPVVRHQLVTPVRSYQTQHLHRQQPRHYPHQPHHVVQPVLGVSRSQLQHDRYPPASYRREQPLNPRVSFYANNYDDEHSLGFEHPADLV